MLFRLHFSAYFRKGKNRGGLPYRQPEMQETIEHGAKQFQNPTIPEPTSYSIFPTVFRQLPFSYLSAAFRIQPLYQSALSHQILKPSRD